MNSGGGGVSLKKHRVAFKHGGGASKGGPVSRWQKFQTLRAHEAASAQMRRRVPQMFASIAELFGRRK